MKYDVWMQLPQPVNGKLPWTLVVRKVSEPEAKAIANALVFPARYMPAAN